MMKLLLLFDDAYQIWMNEVWWNETTAAISDVVLTTHFDDAAAKLHSQC